MSTSASFSPHRSPQPDSRSDSVHSPPFNQEDYSPSNPILSSASNSDQDSSQPDHSEDSEEELDQVSSRFPDYIGLTTADGRQLPPANMSHHPPSSASHRHISFEDNSPIYHRFPHTSFHTGLPPSSSSSHLQFTPGNRGGLEPDTDHEFLDQEDTSHQPPDGNRINHEIEDDESLLDAPESEVEKRALSILGIDRQGRVLPLSIEEETLVQSVWSDAGTCDIRPRLARAANEPLDPNSPLAPTWIRKLQQDVLIRPPSDPAEEEILVSAIRKNLLAIVNNLSEDQWQHPSPPAFLPSSTILSTRKTAEALEVAHEDYLQTEFNAHSQVLLNSGHSPLHSPQPPRQLWLGEDEDDGVDSDVSLADLLNATSAPDSRSSPGWAFSLPRRKTSTRRGRGSSLAQQVSRLGVNE